ncbi:hypothetical protein KTR9_2826 [Gordonia sp. KTR9]|nr:hypothetical protein KTR9_2826 [Gordonia sp. KTR9]
MTCHDATIEDSWSGSRNVACAFVVTRGFGASPGCHLARRVSGRDSRATFRLFNCRAMMASSPGQYIGCIRSWRGTQRDGSDTYR